MTAETLDRCLAGSESANEEQSVTHEDDLGCVQGLVSALARDRRRLHEVVLDLVECRRVLDQALQGHGAREANVLA